MIYIRTGRQNETLKLLDELQTSPVTNDKMYATSTILFGLDRMDESMAIMEELYKVKYGVLIYFNVEQTFLGEEGKTNSTSYQENGI